jgi:hypothetical protein
MERRNPLSKINSDQNFTCQIFENWSKLIFDTGFHLSIQNTWKTLPHVHYMQAGTKKVVRKRPATLNFAQRAQRTRAIVRHEL